MPGFIAWGAMLVGHYAVWSGKGGKVVANAMESIEKFYDKNLDKKIKRLLNINGIRKEVKITRNDERGVFKLKFDDVSIFDPSNFDEDAKSYDRNEDDMEIVDEAKGELKSDNSGISQNDKKIDYYTIELTLKDPNKLETLKLGEVDFCDWEKIFDIKIVSKETGKIVEKGSEEYSNLLDTLDNYAKFTASKGLPNDNLKDKVAVNNDTPIVGAFVNIWNAWIKGQIVKEKIDLEGNEDGNKHIKSLDFLESMGELLNDENEQEILDRYYKSVTRDLENQKRIMEKVRDKYHKEIQNRKKERNKAKLKLALIIIGSVLVIAGVIALAATVLPAAVGGTVAGSILTAAVGGVVAVIKGGIKSLFSFPIFGVATASLVAGIFTKGRSDYKKQRLDNAIKNENEANNVIKEIDEGIDEIKKDKKQVLENIDCIKRHEEVCLDVNSPSFGICLPKLLENIGLIKGLSIKGIDICQKNNKKISELIVKKLNNLLKQANLSADSKLTKLEFDCKFSDLSKENQEKLLRYAQGNFLFKEICFLEIGSDNILEDNNTFKELQRLCEINKYLSGDIKFDNGDYPKQYFSSQEDWYQAILKRLEDNYGWGIENKFNIDESIMNKFQEITVNSVKLCDQVEIYKNRNELLKELSDYSKKVDESKGILNKIFDRVSGKLQADELKNYFNSLESNLRITFLIKYQRGLKYLNVTTEQIFNWIDDNELLKSYVSAIDFKFSELSETNQERLLSLAKNDFTFKEFKCLEESDDKLKELQRLCEINKYLSGDIKLDSSDYPSECFSSQEDWYQAILKRLEDNYDWGIENKFNIDESIMNKFQEITVNSVKLCDQVEIYKNRNELLKELSDYSKKVDESKGILNKIFDRVSGKLQADELKNYFSSLNDKLKITFLIKYQRGLKYLNITAENIFNWIDDNKLLKSYVSAIDFKFSELSETNQERLLSLAKNDFTFKEFKCLEESDDKLKELQRLCEINKYLSGDIKLDSSDYPSECFSSQEDWYQAILKRLEDNYDWGVENKFVVSDDVIEHFIGVKFKNNSDEEIDLYEQVKTYQSRNYLMDFFEIQDYKLMENRIEEYLNDGDKTDDDRLVFYCNYWRAIRSVGVMPTGILELIKDSELLKECLNLVEQEDKDQFLEYVGFNRAEQELLDGVLNLEDLLENEEKFSEWIENFIEHSDWGDGLKFKFWNEIIRNIDNVSEEIKLQIEKIARVFIDHLVEMEGYSEIQKCFRDNALWFIRLITDIQDPKDVNELKSWLEKGDKLVNVKMRDFETNEEYVQEWLELKEIIIEKVNDMIEPKSIDELKPWLDLGKSYNNPTGIVTKKIEKIIKGMSVSSNIGEVEQWLMLLNEYPNHRSLIENKINNIINMVRIANINELKQWVELKEKFDDFEALKIKVNNYSPDGDTLLDICSNWKIVGKLTSKEKLHDKIRAALWIKTGVFGGRYNSLGAYFDALGKVNTKDFLKKIGFTTVEQYLFIELSSLSDNQDDKLSQKILEYMGCFFDWTTVANKKKDILKIIESDLNRHLIKDEMLDEDLRDVVEKSKSIEVGVKLFGEYFDEWSSTFENLNRCLSMLSGVNNLEDMVGKLRNIALSDKQKELLKQVLVDHCNKLITTDNSNYVEIMKLIDNFKQISIEIVNSQPAFGEPILSWRRFNDLVSSNDELSLLVLSSVKIKSCVVNTEERGKMIRKFKLLFDKQRNNLDNFATFVQQIKNLNRDWLKFLLGNQSGDENQLNKLCILIKVWYEVNHPVVLDNQINEKIFDGIYKGLGLVDEGVVDIDEIIGDLINKDLMVMAKVGNVEANKVLQKLNEEFQLSIDLEVNKNGN